MILAGFLGFLSGVLFCICVSRLRYAGRRKSKKQPSVIDHFEDRDNTIYVVKFKRRTQLSGLWEPYIHFYIEEKVYLGGTDYFLDKTPQDFRFKEMKVLSDSIYYHYPEMNEMKISERNLCEKIERRFEHGTTEPFNVEQWLTHENENRRNFARKVLNVQE